jgi:hypothetical protein
MRNYHIASTVAVASSTQNPVNAITTKPCSILSIEWPPAEREYNGPVQRPLSMSLRFSPFAPVDYVHNHQAATDRLDREVILDAAPEPGVGLPLPASS